MSQARRTTSMSAPVTLAPHSKPCMSTPELAEIALEQELQSVFVEYAEAEEEVQMATQYALKKLSGTLKSEIEALTTRRTSEVCRHRTGKAVLLTTVESDISTLKRSVAIGARTCRSPRRRALLVNPYAHTTLPTPDFSVG